MPETRPGASWRDFRFAGETGPETRIGQTDRDTSAHPPYLLSPMSVYSKSASVTEMLAAVLETVACFPLLSFRHSM